jgi:DNA glycosylase AlkZ-like
VPKTGNPSGTTPERTITVAERRARLARRHRLAPDHRAGDVVDAARSMVCLHASDPATVYLSVWARVEGMRVADLERALYVDRTLVKQLAMRRTLFVFPRETLSSAQAGAGSRVAAAERRRLIRDVEKAGLHHDGERWLAEAEAEVRAALSDGREVTSAELRAAIPVLEGTIAYGEGKSWGGQMAVAPRVLTVLSAAGHIVRGSNDGAWTISRPRWASLETWLGEELAMQSEEDGVARLVELWLRTFGPGTVADIRWWLGSTVSAVRKALAELEAVEVDLEGRTGFVLPDDLETDRRRLASGRLGRDPPPDARTDRGGGTAGTRRRGGALDRVVGRHARAVQVPLTAVESARDRGPYQP